MYPTSSSEPAGSGEQEGERAASRRAELAGQLASVRAEIAAACLSAGRDPAEVTLIAVTKTYPASDVRLLAGLGVADFGENRDVEAASKAAECADLRLTWHFIGQLQTNKSRHVVRYADVVHSVDRERLIRSLGSAARSAGREVTCLVQVSVDGDVSRGGVPAGELGKAAEQIEAEAGLVLGGVMVMAPLEMAPELAFATLSEYSETVRAIRPAATIVSAGMSGDFRHAIAAGATHVRIGTALLGARSPRVR